MPNSFKALNSLWSKKNNNLNTLFVVVILRFGNTFLIPNSDTLYENKLGIVIKPKSIFSNPNMLTICTKTKGKAKTKVGITIINKFLKEAFLVKSK